MKIGNVAIGPEHPVCIVAELSSSHNGDLAKAKALIDAASWAGASLVKMQIYKADEMCLPGVKCPGPGPWEGQDLYELYKRTGTPWEWWPPLRDYATSNGVTLFSSAFSPEAVEYLVREGCPAIKIASHEANWAMALMRRPPPVIVSACTRDDIMMVGDGDVAVILWCPPGYPAAALDPADMGWLAGWCDGDDRSDWGAPGAFGLSDNGGPSTRAKSWSDAIRAGASMIEAHIKLDGTHTEDDAFSMTPVELQRLVRFVRECPRRPPDKPSPYRRSAWITRPVGKGEDLMGPSSPVRMLRPAGPIDSLFGWGYRDIRGVAARDLEPGPLRWEDVE